METLYKVVKEYLSPEAEGGDEQLLARLENRIHRELTPPLKSFFKAFGGNGAFKFHNCSSHLEDVCRAYEATRGVIPNGVLLAVAEDEPFSDLIAINGGPNSGLYVSPSIVGGDFRAFDIGSARKISDSIWRYAFIECQRLELAKKPHRALMFREDAGTYDRGWVKALGHVHRLDSMHDLIMANEAYCLSQSYLTGQVFYVGGASRRAVAILAKALSEKLSLKAAPVFHWDSEEAVGFMPSMDGDQIAEYTSGPRGFTR